MQKIRINAIAEGQVFAHDLYSLSGQKLLNAGTALNQRHVAAIRRFGDGELILAASSEELVNAGVLRRFDKSRLRVGQPVAQALLTARGMVLVEAGEVLELHHMDALANIDQVFVEEKAPVDHRRERILLGDEVVEELERELAGLDLRIRPRQGADWIAPADPAAWPDRATLVEKRARAVDSLRLGFARIEAGVSQPLEAFAFDRLLEDLLGDLARHPRQFTQLALLCPRREDYLPDHAYTVTVLGMAVAAKLNWSREDVRTMGLAALLADLGMLLVPERIRTGASSLSDIDRSRVQRHPVFTLSLLKAVAGVPALVRLAALQHHERENGSGYPRATRRDNIADLARVLAVADSFAAATEPRHYRHRKLPYIAMEEAVRAASMVVLWKPAVRALVQAAGLFPVGSYVKLSDGRSAHVICANPEKLDRPVIQPFSPAGQPAGDPVDLALLPNSELAVVRPLPAAA